MHRVRDEEGTTGARPLVNHRIMTVYRDFLACYFAGSERFRGLQRLGSPADVVAGFFADRLARDDFLEKWLSHDPPMRLRRWLLNGFHFFVRERLRAESVEAMLPDELPDDGTPDLGREIDRRFAASVITAACRATENGLRAEGRADCWRVLHAHYFEGQSYATVAASLGVSENVARTKLAPKARRRLRHEIRAILVADGVREEQVDEEIEHLLQATGG